MWYAKFPALELCICLLGYCAAYGGLKPTFRDYLSVPSLRSVPKRRFQTTLRRVITQKTEEFSSTAAEAYDLATLHLSKGYSYVCRVTFVINSSSEGWDFELQSQCTFCTALTVVCCTWNVFWTLRRFVFQNDTKRVQKSDSFTMRVLI